MIKEAECVCARAREWCVYMRARARMRAH